MMICRADFEELFPEIFQPRHRPAAINVADAPSPACVARWEDDGGRAPIRTRRQEMRSACATGDHHPFADPLTTGIGRATMRGAAMCCETTPSKAVSQRCRSAADSSRTLRERR